MPNRLYLNRYKDQSIGGTNPNEMIREIADLGIRWSLPGGIQRIEATVRAFSGYDPYRRYDTHLGDTIAVFDGFLDRYISGQIYEVIPDGRHVTYIAAGAWKRTNDDVYDLTDMGDLTIGTDDTTDYIKDILDDSVTVDASDQTNMTDSSVVGGGWSPHFFGTRAADAIAELAAIGDNADNPMDFYYVDQPFSGVQMQAPLPYFKVRSTTASPDWIFSVRDLAPNGLTLARHIWNLRSLVWIGYGRLTGTDDGADNNTLVDSTTDFGVWEVTPGLKVYNMTDGAVYEIESVATNTITFTEGASGNWNNGDRYLIKYINPLWTSVSTSTNTDYWDVRYREVHMEMDQTQAQQYRDQLAAKYGNAQIQQAFVISAPEIEDGNGGMRPLWRVFMGDSYYFRARDLFPDAAVFSGSDDKKQTFMATAMDYRYATNTLRVVPSTSDSRLDAILGQAGLIDGQIISTETAWRNRKREGE
jgi:hypothetical protein